MGRSDDGTLTTELTIGQRLGTYEVLDFIGVGRLGQVYRARDLAQNRAVTLTLLAHHSEDTLASLVDLARAAARLTHPTVGAVCGVEAADGIYFLTTEYVEGAPLDRHSKTGLTP